MIKMIIGYVDEYNNDEILEVKSFNKLSAAIYEIVNKATDLKETYWGEPSIVYYDSSLYTTDTPDSFSAVISTHSNSYECYIYRIESGIDVIIPIYEVAPGTENKISNIEKLASNILQIEDLDETEYQAYLIQYAIHKDHNWAMQGLNSFIGVIDEMPRNIKRYLNTIPSGNSPTNFIADILPNLIQSANWDEIAELFQDKYYFETVDNKTYVFFDN